MGDGKLIIIISMTVSGLMNDIMTFIVRWIAWRLQLVACATKPLRPVVTGQWSVVRGRHRAVDCVVMPTLMTAFWLRDSLHLRANKLSPRGDAETICPRPPTAVRRRQESRRIYVRPRTGPQSAHLRWLSCRQPACL